MGSLFYEFCIFFVCVKNGNISSKLSRDKECILLHLILMDQIISPSLNVSLIVASTSYFLIASSYSSFKVSKY